MAAIDSALFDLGGLDALAAGRTPIHRLDPRAKLIVALAFIVAVISFGKYDLAALAPFLVYPVALAALGGVPPRALLVRLLVAAPFVLCVGALNPFFDRAPLLRVGPLALSGGWVSFASIVLRFLLTLSAALILVATTGMAGICAALTRLRVPRVFAVQLMLLYRYIFVLLEEGARMVRAVGLRSGRGGAVPLRVYGSLAGQLLLRALDRAQRVHAAMCCRGFDGDFRLARPLRLRAADLLFLAGWVAFFVAARRYNLPRLLGQTVMGVAP